MKILQVSNRVPWPLNEGGTIGIYNYTRAFAALGHQVSLYCLDALKHNTPVAEAQLELDRYAETYIHPINTDLDAMEAFKSLVKNRSYNVDRFYNGSFKQVLIDKLKSEKFDVVQLEGSFVGPYITAIKAHHKGLLSLRMHNAEFEIWERLARNTPNPIKKGYLSILAKQLRSYEQKIIQEVDLVVPVTDDDGAKFKTLVPSIDCFTVPAGIDTNHWKYAPTASYLNWYHIGSMEWHANREAVDFYMKQVHPLLQHEDPDYRLHLAGKGMPHSVYENETTTVHYDVPDAYQFVLPYDVCVVPLKSGSGIRLKILEAMAAGKLVISTSIGAQGINYTAGQNLLIADTPQEYLDLFKRLKNGTIDVLSIVQNARKLIETSYSTEALAQELVSVYAQKKRAV